MNKYLCFLFVLGLCSLAVSAECKPGYESAKVAKVLAVSAGASAPTRADEESPQPAQRVRVVIFDAGGKQYALRLPPSSQEVSVAAGDQVCFRKEAKTIHVLTGDGKPLPGVAHPVREMPQTQ